MQSLGLDIGGANTKAILLDDSRMQKCWLRYIPLWKDKEALGHFLKSLARSTRPGVVGITITGELCDIFQTKQEGVTEIVETICDAFGEDICLFVSLDGTLLTREQSLAAPQNLAAANWVASTSIVGRKWTNCIFMDVGSTTTDIIPLKDGKAAPLGRTDLQRLKTGELVYTGVLRTSLPCICPEVSLGNDRIGIAAENFAIAADVYRVLGMIEEEDYVCETPDGRRKDKKSCMQRIARVFCSDLREFGEEQIIVAAKFFHDKQMELVARGLEKVMRLHGLPRGSEVVVAGLGRNILAKKAAMALGVDEVIDLATLYGEEVALMAPAFGAALLAAEAFEHGCRD
jgi:hypothetical protein